MATVVNGKSVLQAVAKLTRVIRRGQHSGQAGLCGCPVCRGLDYQALEALDFLDKVVLRWLRTK